MKWISLVITSALEIAVVWGIQFMRNTTAIISFLTISLFLGVIVQESREDMPTRPKRIISGFMWGTYVAAAVISVSVYNGYLHL